MSKGIIYVMSTVVPGLIKIGKTGTGSFESRMYTLERNGYNNVVGLKREFAIEVDDYDDKEVLLDEIFSKSKVQNSELFALDIDLVKQLLSSFEGKQVYPETITKEEVFTQASEEHKDKIGTTLIPDGVYYVKRKIKGFGEVNGKIRVENGVFITLKGSKCAPIKGENQPAIRKSAKIVNNILQEDVISNSPSTAAWIVIGANNNGWSEIKSKDGTPIDVFRTNK